MFFGLRKCLAGKSRSKKLRWTGARLSMAFRYGVASSIRLTNIIERLQSGAGENAAFLFGAVNEDSARTPMPLLTTSWLRVGFPPMLLGL